MLKKIVDDKQQSTMQKTKEDLAGKWLILLVLLLTCGPPKSQIAIKGCGHTERTSSLSPLMHLSVQRLSNNAFINFFLLTRVGKAFVIRFYQSH